MQVGGRTRAQLRADLAELGVLLNDCAETLVQHPVFDQGRSPAGAIQVASAPLSQDDDDPKSRRSPAADTPHSSGSAGQVTG